MPEDNGVLVEEFSSPMDEFLQERRLELSQSLKDIYASFTESVVEDTKAEALGLVPEDVHAVIKSVSADVIGSIKCDMFFIA